MIALSDGTRVDFIDYNTALTMEARRRGISDGMLMAVPVRKNGSKSRLRT